MVQRKRARASLSATYRRSGVENRLKSRFSAAPGRALQYSWHFIHCAI
jgi:hypothetical protein